MNSHATSFFEALWASAPHASLAGSRDVYAPLLGAWDARVVDHLPDGTDREQSAEIHFVRVLDGRAVQDVWIVPARDGRSPHPCAEGARHGTTLRVHDPELDAWHITWWNPLTGAECRLVGGRAGSQIVHTGVDAEGRPIRWSFVELGPDSFHWRGERSQDGGRSWVCETEYFARRRVAAVAAAPIVLRTAWEWADRPGLEALLLERTAEGATARGSVLVVLDGTPLWTRYRIEHDSASRFRSARIEVGPPGASRSIAIRRSEADCWTVDGAPRPELAGCEELDLMVTPYTNTPPLVARPLAVGASRRLCVAWLRFPALDFQVVEQEYTRLDSNAGDGPLARYRYRNLASGSEGELTLDADGLVVDHGPWRRR